MSLPTWRDDLQGLVNSSRLEKLETAVGQTRKRVTWCKLLIALDVVILFMAVLALANRLFPGLKPSDFLKIANATLALDLATVTFVLGYLPNIKKGDVDQIVGKPTPGWTYTAIKNDIGDSSGYQKGITWIIALVIFVIAILGFACPDPPKP